MSQAYFSEAGSYLIDLVLRCFDFFLPVIALFEGPLTSIESFLSHFEVRGQLKLTPDALRDEITHVLYTMVAKSRN